MGPLPFVPTWPTAEGGDGLEQSAIRQNLQTPQHLLGVTGRSLSERLSAASHVYARRISNVNTQSAGKVHFGSLYRPTVLRGREETQVCWRKTLIKQL